MITYGNQALIQKAWGRLEEALAFLKKQQIILDHFFGDRSGLLSIVSGKPGDCGQVGALGVRGEILQLHVPDHLLT